MPIGSCIVVDLPQILEDQLGEAARVAEDDRGPVRLDLGHHLFGGIAPRMPRPGHAPFGQQDRDVGLGARIALRPARPCRYRHRARARRDSRRDRRPSPTARRGAAPARSRCSRAMHSAEQVAALAGGEGMDLVDDDRLQPGEHREAVGIAEQQRQRFGRGQQDLRRPDRAGAPCGRTACRRCASRRGCRAPSPSIGVSRLRCTSTASALSGET